ncbi:hypothetical protein KEM09_17900 [Carboxylicivirga mesophila]|uniref:Uncharacterized protein n=1 Tax=Carboxylicivirga mesophila TaxID=1166478 RepID=A0ABS5KFR0_9BACT|nr:DUF6261 family protein [Carboxylicivirga mesophila]MBS2213293.1 hypothetical protein [Carboxylicivirga mesophila]
MHKIAYSLLSNKVLYTFAREVLAIIKTAGIDVTPFSSFVEKSESSLQEFDKALTRDDVNPFTIKINDADRERDLRFLGFKNYIEACAYRKEQSKQQAAHNIKAVIERYGNELYRLSYPEQTAAMQNLLTDLGKEPLKSDCAIVEATAWLDELNADQSHFESLVQQRNSQDTGNSKTLTETRKPLIIALKNLLMMIELQQQIQASDALNALVNHLNNLIDSSMTSARLSKSLSDRANIES